MRDILSVLMMIFIFGCLGQKNKKATAIIYSRSGSSITGKAMFKEEAGTVRIEAEIMGAGTGPLAIHIHSIGDCSSDDGKSSGGHWNPTGEPHGKWGEPPFHSGDLGNLQVDKNGKGKIVLVDQFGRWSIGGSPKTDIIGKAIIIHAGMDDMESQPSGAAGARIGCGVIKKKD